MSDNISVIHPAATHFVYKETAGPAPDGADGGWSEDLHQALNKAGRRGLAGRVFRGEAAAAMPHGVQNIARADFYSWDELAPALAAGGEAVIYRQVAGNGDFPALFDRPGSIHGVTHAKRVLLHVLMLSRLAALTPAEREVLILAAKYHDIGRADDGLCTLHGAWSVEKMDRLGLFAGISGRDAAALRFIIINHCVDDQEALAGADGIEPRTVRLFKMLKDCDGLDRVRIHDLDLSYLRTAAAKRLALVAYQLLYHLPEAEDMLGIGR